MPIPEGKDIVLIPDDVLGILPFESLVVSSAGGKPLYLGDRYRIGYYQSGTAMKIARSLQPPARPRPAGPVMLALGDPIFDAKTDSRARTLLASAAAAPPPIQLMRAVEEVGGIRFPRLKLTGDLVASLSRAIPGGVEGLTGVAASKTKLKSMPLASYRFLVLATHGILDGTVPYVQEPALVLNQVGNPADDDGFLRMTEVVELPLAADMTALTACSTGLGERVSGEGVMGLGRAFQLAGSRGVLVSLWPVAEDSTTKLVERFFCHLIEGKPSKEALRLARASIREAGYDHPFYWAAFILVGE